MEAWKDACINWAVVVTKDTVINLDDGIAHVTGWMIGMVHSLCRPFIRTVSWLLAQTSEVSTSEVSTSEVSTSEVSTKVNGVNPQHDKYGPEVLEINLTSTVSWTNHRVEVSPFVAMESKEWLKLVIFLDG